MGASLGQKSSNISYDIQRDEILKILEVARYAPSGDNCQPWKFEIKGNKVSIIYVDERGGHAMNNNNHATYLALGTLIESMEIASSSHGFRVKSTLLDLKVKTGPIANIEFISSSVPKDSLNDFLLQRCADRRPFSKEFLSEGLRNELLQLANQYEGCTLGVQGHFSKDFEKYVLRSEEFMWLHKEVLEDLFRWVRFSDQEFAGTTDGMAWQNLGLKWFEVPLFKWLRNHAEFPKKFWRFGFKKKVNEITLTAIRNCGGFVGIFVASPKREDIVNAGRLAMRAWLLLTSHGYGVQPLSLASLTAFDFNTGKAPSFSSDEFHRHYSEGVDLFHREFNIANKWMPIWTLRTGKSLSDGELVRTKRQPLSEILV